MSRQWSVSRREFLAGIAALAAAPPATTVRLKPDFTLASAASGRTEIPLITKRVETLYKIAGCAQPNDLQFVPDGLWVLDQVDPNKAFKVRPEDGSVIHDPSDRVDSRERDHVRKRRAVDRLDENDRSGDAAQNPESRSEDGQNAEVVGDAGLGSVRRKHDAIRGTWPEMGRRPILDGGSCFGKALPHGA